MNPHGAPYKGRLGLRISMVECDILNVQNLPNKATFCAPFFWKLNPYQMVDFFQHLLLQFPPWNFPELE